MITTRFSYFSVFSISLPPRLAEAFTTGCVKYFSSFFFSVYCLPFTPWSFDAMCTEKSCLFYSLIQHQWQNSKIIMQLWSILKVILSGSRSVWILYRIILLLIEFMRSSRIHLIPFLKYSWLARITGGRVSAVEVVVWVC